MERLKITVQGAVQGVGFRPFVHRLAMGLGLGGWVSNSPQGVFIEVEGNRQQLEAFLLRLHQEKPPRAIIYSLEFSFLDAIGYETFQIRPSDQAGEKTALVLPDIATCEACLREVFAAEDRRFLYPFTNCTNCGPRFTIVQALPYDRPNTSMRIFDMCPECRREYEEPRDRRFHAQPNACPLCGPSLELRDGGGEPLAEGHKALLHTVEAVKDGAVLALKGLGGFHLIVDARNQEAVVRLRERKRREEKPLAVMFPSIDLVRDYCHLSPFEERLLLSPESPIVLLRKKLGISLAPAVAPNNPYLGIMLPYTPLHHILMRELGFPIVATSGNLRDEPIITEEKEARFRLQGIADLFLVHNRPIVRHVDDSVVRMVQGREVLLRRARGYAPLPIPTKLRLPRLLAVGAHLKNTIALALENRVFVSQHIGDLETLEAYEAFQRIIGDFKSLYGFEPEAVACDMHPEFLSTKYARGLGLPVVEVQHHHAHMAACMAENELESPVLGVSWDGTGYGVDGTIWGGEFLVGGYDSFRRVAHLRTFRLPGGEKAIREPRRAALGVLYELLGGQLQAGEDMRRFNPWPEPELRVLYRMLERGVNCPVTSSAGRLFDAVSSLVGLRQVTNFEGQAAMELEWRTEEGVESLYPFQVEPGEPLVVDWGPMLIGILEDIKKGRPVGEIAAGFHNTLAEMVVTIAKPAGMKKVVLTGGVFQNKYLTERTFGRLEEEGFRVYIHQRVPPNDGGISLGQVLVAAARLQGG